MEDLIALAADLVGHGDTPRPHPELSRPLYHVPHHDGIAGVAANFVLHVNDLMTGRAALNHKN